MISRRNVIGATAALIATTMVGGTQAGPPIYAVDDMTWYITFRQEIANKLRLFVGAARHPLLLGGYQDESAQTDLVAEQFLTGFLGAPRPVEALPSGQWLFSGSVPRQSAYVSYVVMSPDQTRIEAAMMSYTRCPKGGVTYTDPAGGQNLIKCELDPGWAIFVSRYDARNDALIQSLSQLALNYRQGEQRSLVKMNVRTKDSIRAIVEVVLVP